MKKEAQQIAEQIKVLVDQLAGMSTKEAPSQKASRRRKVITNKKGAAGALSILIEEDFLDSPKSLSEIMGKLKEIGRHYPTNTVSMNLLNLTRRRTLTRIGKPKKWQYVLRK